MRSRLVAVLAGLCVAAAILLLSALQVASRAIAAGSGPDAASLLSHLALAAAAAVGGCFLLGVAVETVRTWRRHQAGLWREPRRASRRLVSYVATTLVGLAAAPASHASANPTITAAAPTGGPSTWNDAAGQTGATAPDPGWHPTPERASDSATTPQIRLVGGASRDHSQLTTSITVRRGDCLWDLVARALGPDADLDEVARAWPRWYAANRHVIGADPDLLLPGQVLHAPTAGSR